MMLESGQLVSVQPLPYSAKRYTGVSVIWLMMLRRAAFDLVICKRSRDIQRKRWYKSAHDWLFNDSEESWDSLAFVCDSFGWNLEGARAWARSLTKKDVKRLEHIDRCPRDLAKLLESSVRGKDE